MREYVHAFDVDNTLVDGPMIERAFIRLARAGVLRLSDDRILAIMALRAAGDYSEYIRSTMRGYAEGIRGCSERLVRKIAYQQAESDATAIYPEMQAVLEDITMPHEHVVLISGSPRIFIEAFGRVIGARVADGSHFYTARGVFHPSRPPVDASKNKGERLDSICRHLGAEALAAYGDSRADLPMLYRVPIGGAVAVNPYPDMRGQAVTLGWRIIDCASFGSSKLTG